MNESIYARLTSLLAFLGACQSSSHLSASVSVFLRISVAF